MFGVSATVIIGCMGAAMDFSTLSNADARSQAIADQTALAAAVFVRANGREPSPPPPAEEGEVQEPEEGYLDDQYRSYTAAELGYEFKGWVEGGADNVTVTVNYDGTAKEATVKVTGNTVPTFMQIFGKKAMEFESTAVAKYDDYEFYDPASVLMVLDNSGSMAFDDKPKVPGDGTNGASFGQWADQEDAQTRIDALQGQAKSFMTRLQSLVGDQTADKNKALRTGMLAYNENTISARTVRMGWQTADTIESIDNMVARGGTNSAPPMDVSRRWMSTEDDTHKDIHGKEPLKFLIFMTDGLNSDDTISWIKEEGTGQWRGQVVKCWWNGWYCWWEFETREQENKPQIRYSRNWEEGRYDSNDNILTHSDCRAMKNSGVKIYTIGFALAEGRYDTNGYFGYEYDETIDEDVRDQAYSFLARCASEPATFLTAENSEELDQAFERIGNDIMTEIIRLSN